MWIGVPNPGHLSRGLVLAALLAVQTGCGAPDPLRSWSNRVATYVHEQGLGDPNILRDPARCRFPHDARPGLITIGEIQLPAPAGPFSDRECDVQGVLLGHRQIGGHSWYLFLVGVTYVDPDADCSEEKPYELTDIRAAAMRIEKHLSHWVIGPAQPESVAAYVRTHPPQRGAAAPRLIFPTPRDTYQLRVDKAGITITEEVSQASWRLRFNPSRG